MKHALSISLFLVMLTLYCTDTSTSYFLNSRNNIISFRITSPSLIGIIDTNTNTIRIKVTPDIDLSNIIPVIEIPEGASIEPPSGAVQNFEDTLHYIVTAENGTSNTYKVYADINNYILNSSLHVVHMQRHFINTLGIHNSAAVISSISEILHSARNENVPVVFSKSLPNGNRAIIRELQPLDNEIVIENTSDNPVVEAIAGLHKTNIVVVGIFTNACIEDICRALYRSGFKVYLVKDATSVQLTEDIGLIDSTCNNLERNGIVKLILSNEVLF